MTQIYDILDKIKVLLRNHPIVNSVTFGDISTIDLNKTTMFPLSHFLVSSAQMQRNVITFRVSMLFMDVVDYTKEYNSNDKGNREDETNRIDIYNTQLQVANYVISELKRGDLYSDGYQLIGDPTCELFSDRFENEVAGWSVDLDIQVKNNISVC